MNRGVGFAWRQVGHDFGLLLAFRMILASNMYICELSYRADAMSGCARECIAPACMLCVRRNQLRAACCTLYGALWSGRNLTLPSDRESIAEPSPDRPRRATWSITCVPTTCTRESILCRALSRHSHPTT